VSDRTGSGLVELAVLETMSAATAGRPRAHVDCTEAVASIEERIGLGPRYGYEVLLDLARPWIVPVPLVSVAGSKGDRVFPEAARRNTPNAAWLDTASANSAPSAGALSGPRSGGLSPMRVPVS
jgi:hypothetical protein